MKPWNPETHPYRVLFICQSSQPGCFGWSSRVKVFATEDEALAAVDAPMPAGTYRAEAQRIDLSRGWPFRWVTVYMRDRRKKKSVAKQTRNARTGHIA